MHVISVEHSIMGTSAIVGGGIPIAVGSALGSQMKQDNTKGVAAAPAAGVNAAVIGKAMASGVDGDIISVLLAPGRIQGA